MLAKLAAWSEEGVHLDSRIVLGAGLLGDRSRTFVRFDVESVCTVTVHRAKLYEASKALRFADLSCWLDKTGLRFSWRDGRGGLRLVDQHVDLRDAETALTVAIAQPRPKVEQRVRPSAAPVESRWLADGFSDANLF